MAGETIQEAPVSDPSSPAAAPADDMFGRGEAGSTVSAAGSPSAGVSGVQTDPSTTSTRAPAAPADPNMAAALRGQPTQAASPDNPAGWRSVREEAESLGYHFGAGVTDNRQALAQLVRQAESNRQADYYAQLGRQLAPHAPQLQQFITQQQAPAAPSEWEKPAFDPRWKGLVDFNENAGRYVGKQGVPAEIVDGVNRYADWIEKRESDPEGFVTHYAEKVARKVFEEQFQAANSQTKSQSAVEQIRRENAGWIYQGDGQGGVQTDAFGRPSFSPAGQRYAQHVQRLVASGMTDVRMQHQYALASIQAEIASANTARAAQGQQQTSPQTQHARTAPNANPLGTLPPSQQAVRNGVPAQSTRGKTLSEAMREAAEREGLGPNDFDMLADQ